MSSATFWVRVITMSSSRVKLGVISNGSVPTIGGGGGSNSKVSGKSFMGRRRISREKNVNISCCSGDGSFPAFLPKEVENIKDPFARALAKRIERVPVQIESEKKIIMSSCVKPKTLNNKASPVVLLHCFDSSCLEWRCTYPLLEEAGLDVWAVDVLGWGFSDLETCPSCDVASKRRHLYELWRSYIKRPMILVGPSLGASVAIDFTMNYPEAVDKLVLINPSVYAEGTGNLARLPEMLAYAGVTFLKSIPLRFYANLLAFNDISPLTVLDWTNVGRLHCLLPWWKYATVSFMFSGGYNVVSKIKQVNQKTLIISSENDRIVSYKLAVKLHSELPDAIIHRVPDSGHLPHVDMPNVVAKLIADFTRSDDQLRTRIKLRNLLQGQEPILLPTNE